MVMLLTLLTAPRPKFITIRLPEAESKHLVLLTSLRSMEIGSRVTIKSYLETLILNAGARSLQLPKKRSVPAVSNEKVGKRISLEMTDGMYAAIDVMRGTRAVVLVDGEPQVQDALDYGNADLVRELIELEYKEKAKGLVASSGGS